MNMNIYKISQQINEGWDTYSEAIVIAKTASDAQKIHPSGDNDDWTAEHCDSWVKNPKQVVVQQIGTAGHDQVEGTVVCANFYAG